MSIADVSGYSASVVLRLHIDGRELPLAEVAPDFCVLKVDEVVDAGNAEITVTIDGHVQRRRVELLPPSPDDPRRIPLREI